MPRRLTDFERQWNAIDAHCTVALLSDIKDSEIALESEPVTDQPKAAEAEAAEDGAADDGAGGEDGKDEILHKMFSNSEMASFFRRS